MKCTLCGREKFNIVKKRIRDSHVHSVVTCKKCGLVQLSPRPSLKKEQEFYDKNLQSKNILSPTDIKTITLNSLHDTNRRADFVGKHCNKKSHILDIGSGDGLFLKEMEGRGYNITGLEVSKERRETSKKVAKAKVLDINLLKDQPPADFKKFDGVTLIHVLEHIIDPVLFLQNIAKNFLKKDGSIIIEVPNLDDLLVVENKQYDAFYWQRGHVFYFNKKTLTQVVKKGGFLIKSFEYVQRYGLENFMHGQVKGKPQIDKPTFQIEGEYKWLEDYYKSYLCKIGKSDTMIIVIKP
ncbi:MAG: hypothetical protein A3I87_02785 [Candidatus Staskawiczbacteria bacterium RIFCSPLOWO2_02_FULL_39_8]|nr:MAG: hypothetical protein A3I87_02785 [Candidatus Staskawiczbacteria bacterium RIFCSPLOWO2_02_FULL_39_8]